MASQKFSEKSVPIDFQPPIITIPLQRWVAEMFINTCFAYSVNYDTALLAATYAYNTANRDRFKKGFWTERIPISIQISRATYIRLGLLGVWGLRDESTEGTNFVHSRANKLSGIVSSSIFSLPEHLVKRGLALDHFSREEYKPKNTEIMIPNGIYLEMIRESDIRKVSFNQMVHEAIIQTKRILPLKFGPGTQQMRFKLKPMDIEKVESLASIHQITFNKALVYILGGYFFVGEEIANFVTTESGESIEIWD